MKDIADQFEKNDPVTTEALMGTLTSVTNKQMETLEREDAARKEQAAKETTGEKTSSE